MRWRNWTQWQFLSPRHCIGHDLYIVGGHIKPATYSNLSRNADVHGEQAAVEIAQFEASQLFAVKNLVEKENIDCDFQMTRALDVYMDEKVARTAEQTYRRSRQRHLIPDDVQYIAKKDAPRV